MSYPLPVAQVAIGLALEPPEGETHTISGYAITFPLPPGPVTAKVTVDAAEYETPFEEEIAAGTRVFKATSMDQTLEEEVAVDKDLTILFVFDPATVLSRVLVLPAVPLPV